MKKTASIIVTLLGLWGVSTYMIGNQTQNELEKYINKSNKIYADKGIALKLTDYKHSFLDSTAQIEVDFKDPEIIKVLSEDYKLPLKITYNIEHGPLFFKNGFGIGLEKIDNRLLISSLLKDNAKKEFLKILKDDINLKTAMIVSFDKQLNYTIESDKIDIDQDNKQLSMTPLKIEGTTDIENFKGNGKVNIQKVTFKEDNSSDGVELDNLAVDVSIDEIIKETLLFGDFKFSIAKVLIKDSNNPNLKEINFAINGLMSNRKVTKDIMDSTFKASINLANTKLDKVFKDLERINIGADMKNLGIEGMYEFQNVAKTIQDERVKLVENIQNQNQEEMRVTFAKLNSLDEKMIKKILPTLNKLLIKDKTNLSYSVDIDTKDKKSTKANIKIGYTGDIDFNKDIKKLTEEIKAKLLSTISLNVDINLNKKHLSMLPIPMLEQQLQMGVAQGFIKDNNSSYILNGYYKNRELMVNDNNLTSTVLPLLMMFTAH